MKAASKKWVMPDWMEQYRDFICNTGGNSVEELMNDDSRMDINMPRALLSSCVSSQVYLLNRMHKLNLLKKIKCPTH